MAHLSLETPSVTPELAVLRGIRDANFHRPGIRCLRLYRLTDDFFSALASDIAALREAESASNPVEPGHITHWTHPSGQVLQFSLWNATGRYDDFGTDHDLSCFGKRFRDGARYPRVAQLIDELPHLVNFRANVLGPGARLAPHEEHALFRAVDGAIGVRARFHLPITSNPAAEVCLDGDVHHLEPGVLYFINHGCVHTASNEGSHERVHLVWDMLMTADAYVALFGGGLASRIPIHPVSMADRVPVARRREDPGHYARLVEPVSAADAERVGLCAPQ